MGVAKGSVQRCRVSSGTEVQGTLPALHQPLAACCSCQRPQRPVRQVNLRAPPVCRACQCLSAQHGAACLKGVLKGGQARRGAVHVNHIHLKRQRHARVSKVPASESSSSMDGRVMSVSIYKAGVRRQPSDRPPMRTAHSNSASRAHCDNRRSTRQHAGHVPPNPPCASPGQELLLCCRSTLWQHVPHR